ncbi:fluoride efflux transporter CrcB [Cytobacillus massiliigabonensis]|uniref:fluoride efflux transporter CrcB n=1 Tax=Cytobacillus massiliigabonensis TaxID=1871011 RepID=UPI000C8354ED|nr:fluoride efflux transporter CrcB [Cytobacillus massiliigabonensis]
MIYVFIGIGGIAGSLLRYFVSIWTDHLWAHAFPYGTLIANLTGSFLLGIFTRKYGNNEKVNRMLVLLIGTGAIGSYTTMSTFSTDMIKLIDKGDFGIALLYILLSLTGGLAASWFGYFYPFRKVRT